MEIERAPNAMQKDGLKRYLEAIYNRCFRILKDPDLAWDALQDVFELYYEASKQKEIQQPLHYLYRISTNHCINLLRRESRLVPLFASWHPEPTDESHRTEHRLLLDALSQTLDEEDLNLLVYRHVDQMTYGEIADIVGMSDRGVKKKLERLEESIRQHFDGQV